MLNDSGNPEFYRFRLEVPMKHFAIEACDMNAQGAHRFRGFSMSGYCQNSLSLIGQLYDLCGGEYEKSYTVYGIVLYDGTMVGFDLKKAVETKEE